MLNNYIAATQQLLANPTAPSSLYPASNLTTFINTARFQLAGETECCLVTAKLTITTVTNIYQFSSIAGLGAGAQGVFNVRQASYVSGTGQLYMGPRPYPWAQSYWLNSAAPVAGTPSEWAQYNRGTLGSIVVNPLPDTTYVLNLDCSVQPIALATDVDPEIIPYPASDAVPYFAAYYAYMSSQRQSDADLMMKRYQTFVARYDKAAMPDILPSFHGDLESRLVKADPDLMQVAMGGGGGGGGA